MARIGPYVRSFMGMHGKKLPRAINSIHKDQTLDIFIKSMVSLKMSILQIWVTWASKITLKNLQLCGIKIKGSHTPCDSTCSHSIQGLLLGCRPFHFWLFRK